MDTIDTYCPYCDIPVAASLTSNKATLKVLGKDVSYLETLALCPFCGEAIGDTRIEDLNLKRAYKAYEERYGISVDHLTTF